MENKKFNLARYLISDVEKKIKFCFICNKEVLAKNFTYHLFSKKHKQRASYLDFLADCEPEEKFCFLCLVSNKDGFAFDCKNHVLCQKHKVNSSENQFCDIFNDIFHPRINVKT